MISHILEYLIYKRSVCIPFISSSSRRRHRVTHKKTSLAQHKDTWPPMTKTGKYPLVHVEIFLVICGRKIIGWAFHVTSNIFLQDIVPLALRGNTDLSPPPAPPPSLFHPRRGAGRSGTFFLTAPSSSTSCLVLLRRLLSFSPSCVVLPKG